MRHLRLALVAAVASIALATPVWAQGEDAAAARSNYCAHGNTFLREEGLLDQGLDAIKAANWKLVVEKLSLLIDKAHFDVEIRRLNCKHTNVVSYEKFAALVPAYVFGNLALASDKTGGAPLRSAELYRAYLAYDPETQSRRQIEGRIGELEKAHKAYVAPICSIAEALVDKFSATSAGGWTTEHTSVQVAISDCLWALVLIGDMSNARSLEARLRSGYFSRGHPGVDPGVIDLAYARAYRALGREAEAATHASRVVTANEGTVVKVLLRIFHEEKPVKEEVRPQIWDDWPSAGRAGGALFWYATLVQELTRIGPMYSSTACRRQSVADIAAFLAAYDSRRATSDRAQLGYMAGDHACAAATLANYWLYYQRKIERFNGRRP